MRALIVLAFFLVVFLYVHIPYRLRARAMRELAQRWGLSYTRGMPFRWPWTKGRRLPAGFNVRGHPTNLVRYSWNVLEGELSGVRVLIFDSVIGQAKTRGSYCTIVAVRTKQNLFTVRVKPENISVGQEWSLLYRRRFWQIGWTLSTERLDEVLLDLSERLKNLSG
ncbi:MAG TPA: hypothetical protein VIM62_00825 [Acidobacteriaceae bacterium]